MWLVIPSLRAEVVIKVEIDLHTITYRIKMKTEWQQEVVLHRLIN